MRLWTLKCTEPRKNSKQQSGSTWKQNWMCDQHDVNRRRRRTHPQELKWHFCPSHAGVRVHEKADWLVTRVAPGKVGKEDIILSINNRLLHKEPKINDHMQIWLMESGIKFGTSRKECGRWKGRGETSWSLKLEVIMFFNILWGMGMWHYQMTISDIIISNLIKI